MPPPDRDGGYWRRRRLRLLRSVLRLYGYGYGSDYGTTDYPYGFGLGYGLYSGFGWAAVLGDYRLRRSVRYGGGYGGGYAVHDVYGRGEQGNLKLKVKPRAAKVYVDGYFVGMVDEFDGAFQKLALNTRPPQGRGQGGRLRDGGVRRADQPGTDGDVPGGAEANPVTAD